MSEIEKRFMPTSAAELRVLDPDGKRMLVGWAGVHNSLSEEMGPPHRKFRERVASGTFQRSISRGPDVIATIDHDESKIMGRVSAGTLRIKAEERGLYVEVDPPNTSYANDLQESIRRGDVKGMSFSFKKPVDKWGQEFIEGRSMAVRELQDFEIVDVSFVIRPAYLNTEVALRSLKEWEESLFDQEGFDARSRRLDLACREGMAAEFGVEFP